MIQRMHKKRRFERFVRVFVRVNMQIVIRQIISNLPGNTNVNVAYNGLRCIIFQVFSPQVYNKLVLLEPLALYRLKNGKNVNYKAHQFEVSTLKQ